MIFYLPVIPFSVFFFVLCGVDSIFFNRIDYGK